MSVHISTGGGTVGVPGPAQHWSTSRRYVAAAALVGLGALWSVGEVTFLGHEGGERSAWIATHPVLSGLGISADMLSVPLIFAAATVWFALSRSATPRWAWAGVGLLTCAAAGQGMLEGAELIAYLVARQPRPGLDAAALSAVMDNASGPPVITFMVLFLVGAFVGILVSMVAVWRSRALPRAAVVLLLVSQAVEVLDVSLVGNGLGLIALAWMGLHLVRLRPVSGQVPRAA